MARRPAASSTAPAARAPDQRQAPFYRRVLIAAGIFVAVLLLLYFLWQAANVMLLIFAGVLLAIFLRSLAEGLSKFTGLSLKWSLVVVILVLVAAAVVGGWLMAARILAQFEELATALPQSVEALRGRIAQNKLGAWLVNNPAIARMFDPQGQVIFSRTSAFLSSIFGAVVAVIMILVTGLYLAFDPTLYTNGLLRLFPRHVRPKAAETLGALNYTLRWWLVAQFIDMWIIAVLTALGLWMLGVKLALVLGILAGLFNFIPNFGPLVSLVPATLLASMDGPDKALAVIVFYIVLQSIEGYVLLPLLQRKAVDTPPVLLIAAQVLMGVTVGSLGLLLAAPLVACTMVLVKMLYVEEALGDSIETPADNIDEKDIPPVPNAAPAR